MRSRPPVIDLSAYASARGPGRAVAKTARRSQQLYKRLIGRAEQARKRDFRHALEQGMSTHQLAEAVGLGIEEIERIVAK
jgi:hypothetical protein